MDFKEYSIGEFDTEEQKKFRQEVREWIDKNMDRVWRYPRKNVACRRTPTPI